MNPHYLDTARLLIQVAPLVFEDGVFALKGGTVINLFMRDMPRLSVDLDLAVAAEVILTHGAEVKVTHLGEDDGLFGAVDVDPGGSSGDTSDGPKGRRGEVDRQAAELLAQHGAAVPA